MKLDIHTHLYIKLCFLEIRIGRNLRPRCNTERKLEKLKNDRSKQSEVHTISWRESKPKNGDEEPTEDLFPKKERQNDNDKSQTKQYKLESLLSQQIATVPAPKENPFADYSRCDATSEKSENSTSIRVFLTGKLPNSNYFLNCIELAISRF